MATLQPHPRLIQERDEVAAEVRDAEATGDEHAIVEAKRNLREIDRAIDRDVRRQQADRAAA